jgi:hypothetical protein
MKKSGKFVQLLLLVKRCALVVVVGGFILFGLSILRLCWERSSRIPAEFPRVGPSSKIILNLDDSRWRKVDVSGQKEIIDAIGGLKHQHIVGRSIGYGRVQGFLEIDGEVFKLDAAMIEDGFRAAVENETDTWEGRELGEVLYRTYGGK